MVEDEGGDIQLECAQQNLVQFALAYHKACIQPLAHLYVTVHNLHPSGTRQLAQLGQPRLRLQ